MFRSTTSKLCLGRLLKVYEMRVFPKPRNIHISSILSGITVKSKGLYVFPESNADIEISTAEWEYVERLKPMTFIPKPNVKPGDVTPSGWKAPSANKEDHPYYVTRDRSHMFRIHKDIDDLKCRIRTKLKGIEGDVFALGKDLEAYLLPLTGKRCITMRMSEPNGTITFKGDLVNPITDFLHQKGF